MNKSDEEPREYASPPCYAHEFEGADEPRLTPEQVAEVLQELLEGERAGARIARESRSEAEKAHAPVEVILLLDEIGGDEARYCGVLIAQLKALHIKPGEAIGSFYDKCMAIENLRERLSFLNRGQKWVMRKIDEILPSIYGQKMRSALTEMSDTHRDNIAKTEDMIDKLA